MCSRVTWKSSNPSSCWQHFKPLRRRDISLQVFFFLIFPALFSPGVPDDNGDVDDNASNNRQHLLVTYYVPGVILSNSYILIHVNPLTTL